MRAKIIAGNWKLHKTVQESLQLIAGLKDRDFGSQAPKIIVCPVYTSLSAVAEISRNSYIKVGAQDMYWEEKGAFTGTVSAPLIKDVGCDYVIVGHSERRQLFGETDETVNKKIQAALNHQLSPIVCVGETLEEREAGATEKVLDTQIRGAFQNLSSDHMSKCVIAYEPVWAIGTGKVATPEQAQESHQFIRRLLTELSSKENAEGISMLYGGSVKPENASQILEQADVDGALVGGASLVCEHFVSIIEASSKVKVS